MVNIPDTPDLAVSATEYVDAFTSAFYNSNSPVTEAPPNPMSQGLTYEQALANVQAAAQAIAKKKKTPPKFNNGDIVRMTTEHDGFFSDLPGEIISRSYEYNRWYYTVRVKYISNYYDPISGLIKETEKTKTWSIPESKLEIALYTDGLDNWE